MSGLHAIHTFPGFGKVVSPIPYSLCILCVPMKPCYPVMTGILQNVYANPSHERQLFMFLHMDDTKVGTGL